MEVFHVIKGKFFLTSRTNLFLFRYLFSRFHHSTYRNKTRLQSQNLTQLLLSRYPVLNTVQHMEATGLHKYQDLQENEDDFNISFTNEIPRT